jgi:TM2 domain-containing membrane protein YozV
VAASSTPAVSVVRTPLPPPPHPSSRPASTEELQQIANRVVPSMFGAFIDEDKTTATEPYVEPQPLGPPKNRTTYIVLGALLGALGAHNFYAGYRKKGAIQLAITALTLGFGTPMSWIWAIIDICTVEKDSHGVQFES